MSHLQTQRELVQKIEKKIKCENDTNTNNETYLGYYMIMYLLVINLLMQVYSIFTKLNDTKK